MEHDKIRAAVAEIDAHRESLGWSWAQLGANADPPINKDTLTRLRNAHPALSDDTIKRARTAVGIETRPLSEVHWDETYTAEVKSTLRMLGEFISPMPHDLQELAGAELTSWMYGAGPRYRELLSAERTTPEGTNGHNDTQPDLRLAD